MPIACTQVTCGKWHGATLLESARSRHIGFNTATKRNICDRSLVRRLTCHDFLYSKLGQAWCGVKQAVAQVLHLYGLSACGIRIPRLPRSISCGCAVSTMRMHDCFSTRSRGIGRSVNCPAVTIAAHSRPKACLRGCAGANPQHHLDIFNNWRCEI